MDSGQKKAKIVIIDDNLDTVELLRKRFRAEGYETAEAYDGEAGIRKVRDFLPDLIILDIMMPKIDGFSACEQLRQDEKTKHIPILMVTAKSDVSDTVRGLDIGADGYIPKPFDFKEVSARVRSLLAKKNASEEKAEREKFEALDHIVDEVSHEVRNPLVAIGGFARRLERDLPEGGRERRYVEIILQNVTALEKMVDQLIDLKTATITYPEPSNINELVKKALALHGKRIEKNQIEIAFDLMQDPPGIQADQTNLTTAISNIIANSLEAMDGENRLLKIKTAVSDGYFEIRIIDSGKGIPKDKIKNIYDPFFTSKVYGPGLGLTFTLKTIQSHNGMITVESEENKGTTFTIKLPVISRAGDE